MFVSLNSSKDSLKYSSMGHSSSEDSSDEVSSVVVSSHNSSNYSMSSNMEFDFSEYSSNMSSVMVMSSSE